MSDQRYHSLDAVRAVALILGVVFHASLSFHIPPPWWVGDDWSRSTTLSALAYVIHIFRMSAFYLIAGFFAHVVYHRRGARGFAVDRLKRIAVPLAVGFVVIGAAVKIPWMWGLQVSGVLPAAMARRSPWGLGVEGYLDGSAYRAPGFSWTHLWFLYYLLVFYVAWLLARRLIVWTGAADRSRAWIDATLLTLHTNPLGLLAFVVPVSLGFWLNRESLYAVQAPDKSVVPLASPAVTYGTWFVFGWLLHRQPNLLECWRRRWVVHACAGVVISLALFALVLTKHPPATTPASLGAAGLLYAAGSGLACVLLVAGFAGFFERFASTHSPTIRYLADSSYWMYLVHLPVVLYLQVLMGPWHFHWTAKFTAITLLTIGVCLVSYRYLVRYTWVGRLLNGPR